MSKQSALAVLFLNRQSVRYLSATEDKSKELIFNSEIVSGLEVKKTDLLNDQVRLFIEQNKIPPGPFVVLLAEEICLVKIFPEGTQETKKEEIKKFLDLVPFENVRSKIYPFEKGLKLYAVNRDYYEIVEAAFEKYGFRAEATTPLSMLGPGTTDKNIFTKLNLAKQSSLSGQTSYFEMNDQQRELLARNKRLTIMLGIFGALILILVFMIIFVLKPFETKPRIIRVVKPSEQTVVSPVVPVASEAGEIDPREIKVRILNGSPITGQAGQMREIFLDLGFKEITVGNVTGVVPKSNLVYTASVSAKLLDKVVEKLKTNFPDLNVSPTASGDFGMIFTIGRDLKVKIAP